MCFACVCACTRVCMHGWVRVCVCVREGVCMFLIVCVCMQMHACVRACVCVCVHVFVCIRACTRLSVCMCVSVCVRVGVTTAVLRREQRSSACRRCPSSNHSVATAPPRGRRGASRAAHRTRTATPLASDCSLAPHVADPPCKHAPAEGLPACLRW